MRRIETDRLHAVLELMREHPRERREQHGLLGRGANRRAPDPVALVGPFSEAARSISTRLTEASASFFFRNSRTRKSVWTWAGNCFLPAYHLDTQSRVMPKRMANGLTF